MVSLYKEYKKISSKYGSYLNKNSLSDTIIPTIKTKTIVTTSSKKNNYQRNRNTDLDFYNKEYMNDSEQLKQNPYYTILNRGNNDSKFQSFNSLEDNKDNDTNTKNIKIKLNQKRYNNYYIASNLLKHKYISDLVHEKKYNQPMRRTDDKINNMIKYLNINQNFKTDKVNILSHSMTQRFNFEEKKNKAKTIEINSKELNKIKLTNKKIGANLLLPSQKLSKDMYLYKKIFYYADKKKTIRSEKGLDNKLNIIYSENESQYKQNINKLNEIYKLLGKKKIYNIELSQSENKVKSLQKRVDFMKRIVDYTYPDMVLTKIKEQDKTIYEKSVVPVNIITSKVKRKNHNRYNRKISQGLIKSLNIQKCVFKRFNKKKTYEH